MDENIFQLLTQNPNKWMSVVRLFNEYKTSNKFLSNTYSNQKNFLIECELLNTKFKNVRKTHKNGLCYLAFVTDDSLLYYPSQNLYSDPDTTSALCEPVEPFEIIEYMIENPEYHEKISLTEYFNGVDTILHILFKKGRIDLIKKLMIYHNDIDFDIKNAVGQTVIDSLPNDSEETTKLKLVTMYYDMKMEKNRKEYEIKIKTNENMVKSLLEENSKLIKQNNELKKTSGKYYSGSFALYCILFVFILFMLI